jgi:hypothetical protein
MTIDMHIVRKIVIGVFLSMALMAELTMLATATSAQDYASGPASAPSPISAGSPINSAASGTSNLPIGAVNPSQVPPNASMLAVPVVGNAPLTVDLFIGLANTPGSLLYEWNFGDGTEAFLPAKPYMIHVYQNPGTYICQLELVALQGISTIASTKITVTPPQG